MKSKLTLFFNTTAFSIIALSIFALSAMANGQHSIDFPAWTYYVEIVQHSAIAIIAIAMIFIKIKFYNASKNETNETKQILTFITAGWGILALSEISTIFHHFLVYPFGIYNAIVNHGLLLVAIAMLAAGYFRLLRLKFTK